MITGGLAGLLSVLLLSIALVLYPAAYAIFTVLYALYGVILDTTGPLVLTLMPTSASPRWLAQGGAPSRQERTRRPSSVVPAIA